jgi:ABC-type transport system involved in cytochrome c biogenesis ATPase subunit
MPAPDMLLSMRDVQKRFAGVAALSGATLEVARGEVHALIGQNGAGKSTLIKILTGYHRRDAGEVVFDGQPLEARTPAEAQSLGISTIHQEINLVGYRSVTENICLGPRRRRFGLLDWRAMHREAEAALARLGVEVDVRRPLSDHTTAVQQMVAIARGARLPSEAGGDGRADLLPRRPGGGGAVRRDPPLKATASRWSSSAINWTSSTPSATASRDARRPHGARRADGGHHAAAARLRHARP